jgi:2-polyprenyl-3-methyl-5-hydroxy-6-metoxy-1,4-benzoquinol methylase
MILAQSQNPTRPREQIMQDVSPALFLDSVLGHVRAAAIKAAIELDLFTAVGEGASETGAIAKRTGAAERGVQALADYLTVMGFLEKRDGCYGLTPSTATFLDRRSPAYLGSIHQFLASPELVELALKDPAGFVRNGGSAGLANVAPDNPVWVTFARSMAPFMAPVAAATAGYFERMDPPPGRILDIAAGHGLFGIEFARRFAGSEVTALDWGPVLDVARENATAAKVSGRYRTLTGSAFEVPFGGPYDLVLMPNFLHHFEEAACIAILKKARAALAPGGRVVVVEFVPNEDRVSPAMPAMFAFLMLATTPGGTSFPPSVLTRMFVDAGFAKPEFVALPPSPQTLVMSKRADGRSGLQ